MDFLTTFFVDEFSVEYPSVLDPTVSSVGQRCIELDVKEINLAVQRHKKFVDYLKFQALLKLPITPLAELTPDVIKPAAYTYTSMDLPFEVHEPFGVIDASPDGRCLYSSPPDLTARFMFPKNHVLVINQNGNSCVPIGRVTHYGCALPPGSKLPIFTWDEESSTFSVSAKLKVTVTRPDLVTIYG